MWLLPPSLVPKISPPILVRRPFLMQMIGTSVRYHPNNCNWVMVIMIMIKHHNPHPPNHPLRREHQHHQHHRTKWQRVQVTTAARSGMLHRCRRNHWGRRRGVRSKRNRNKAHQLHLARSHHLPYHTLTNLSQMLSRHVQPGGLRNDFPPWVSEKARKILKSRFKLWSALYKHVDNNGPMKPLKVIKHAYQSEYNGGKWGLDKSTENYLKICVQASTSLESKYICRLFDGLVANSWIYDKSHFTIMPYVTQFREKHGRDPTREQIRQKA